MGLSAPSGSISRRSLSPHPRLRSVRAFFTGRPRVGTLLSLLCFRRGVPKYYPRPTRLRLHPHLTRSFFPRRGKRSLIPPCAPSIRRRVYQPTDPAMKMQHSRTNKDKVDFLRAARHWGIDGTAAGWERDSHAFLESLNDSSVYSPAQTWATLRD
jgi:hypothetical protein